MQCCAYTEGRVFFISSGAVPKSTRGDEVVIPYEDLPVAHQGGWLSRKPAEREMENKKKCLLREIRRGGRHWLMRANESNDRRRSCWLKKVRRQVEKY